MTKQTLLELTQEVLSSLDGDEVNSISDTTESAQVATIVRRVYYDIISRSNLPEHFDLFELTASGDSLKPTLMYRPARVNQLIWIKYDKIMDGETAPNYQMVDYKDPTSFLAMMDSLNTDETDVASFTHTIEGDSITFNYRNDKAPDWWTSFDDYTFVFDSYDAEVDTTLQKNKTKCYGLVDVTWTHNDAFTPDLDAQQFSLLVNEAKSLAWAELKQAQHMKAEQSARRQWIHLQQSKNALPAKRGEFFSNLPNYGRRR